MPNKHYVPNNVKIGRMVAREFGVKKCTRNDALEIEKWAHGLSSDDIKQIHVNSDPFDALDILDSMLEQQ